MIEFDIEVLKNLLLSNNIKLRAIEIIYKSLSNILMVPDKDFKLESITDVKIIDKTRSKLKSSIMYDLNEYDKEQLENYCLSFANTLSKFSCTIFNEIIVDQDLSEILNFLKVIVDLNGKDSEVQEILGLLKAAVDSLYKSISYYEPNKQKKSLNLTDFVNILDQEASIIILGQLRQIIKNNHRLTNTQLKDFGNRLDEYQKINEKLYTSNVDKIINLFKNIYGFDNESLRLLIESNLNGLTKESLKKIMNLSDTQFEYFEKIMFYKFKENDSVYKYKDVNCSLFTTPFYYKNKKIFYNKYAIVESSLYLRRRIINQNIELDKRIKSAIKKLRNEAILKELSKKLRDKGFEPICNKDFGQDKNTKGIFENEHLAHEIDLAFVIGDTLNIYELKDFAIPFSIEEIEKLDKKILKKTTSKLKKLETLLNANKVKVQQAIGHEFKNIRIAILLTRNIKGKSNYKNIPIFSVDEFVKKFNL